MNDNGTMQMPPQASTFAPHVDDLYYFIFWGCAVFFAIIVGASLFFIFKYRRREGQVMESRAYHNTPLEITWTVIPTILVMIVFVWGFKDFMMASVAPANSLDYYVTGKRWLWEIKDPNGQVTLNEMTVPVDQPVKLILRSDDLIHSFFIPSFRVKQDVLPNRYHTMWFEATRTGDFDIFCTEYCGTGHSEMLGKVHVVSREDYEKYLEEGDGLPEGMTPAEWGKELYAAKACITCHSLDGSKVTGPSFQGLFGKSETLADGSTVTVDEEYIRSSILDPASQIVAGFEPVMPTYSGMLKPDHIDALIAFIKEQK